MAHPGPQGFLVSGILFAHFRRSLLLCSGHGDCSHRDCRDWFGSSLELAALAVPVASPLKLAALAVPVPNPLKLAALYKSD